MSLFRLNSVTSISGSSFHMLKGVKAKTIIKTISCVLINNNMPVNLQRHLLYLVGYILDKLHDRLHQPALFL